MNKKVQYETVIKNLELILNSEPTLSVNAKMSIIASALHTTFSHWTFCGFYVICKPDSVHYTHLRAHETVQDIVCRLLLEQTKTKTMYKIREKHSNSRIITIKLMLYKHNLY